MAIITSTDLKELKKSVSILKNKVVIWYNNIIIGNDSDDYIIYTKIPSNSKIVYLPNRPVLINARDLTKFINNLSDEDTFSIIDAPSHNYFVNTITTKNEISLILENSNITNYNFNNRIDSITNINNSMNLLPNLDVTDIIKPINEYNKSYGTVEVEINGYKMFLVSGVIPIGKDDRCYVTILDQNPNTFITRFQIHKKSHDIYIYLNLFKF